MLYNFCRIPQEDSSLGFTNDRKMKERVEGLNPFWNRLKVEVFLCPFGQQIPFKPALPVKNQRTILRCKSHEINKKSTVTMLVQNLQFYIKKSERKYDRNMKFRGLKTEFSAT